jgi:5-hydroxyisourate hydrolase
VPPPARSPTPRAFFYADGFGRATVSGQGTSTLDFSALTQNLTFTLNADGRNPDGPLYDNASLQRGTYRLVFDVAAYFRARGVTLPDPAFLDQVQLDFGVADTSAHYHVPLLCSPWSYSTYRGS